MALNRLVGEGVRNLPVWKHHWSVQEISPMARSNGDPSTIAPPINYGLAEPMTSQGYPIIHGDLMKIQSTAQNIEDQESIQGRISKEIRNYDLNKFRTQVIILC